MAGDRLEPLLVRAALDRLIEQQPFLNSLKYAADCAEIQYWEEADNLVDASSLALRMWDQHREVARLPDWEVIGLEVVEKRVFHGRVTHDYAVMVGMRDVKPLPF